MRILRISGENLASLEQPFTIDFQTPPLRDTGLFAITGPTGSGKSTILDAVYLALFGRVPRLEGIESKENFVPDVNGHEYNAANAVAILRRGASHARAEVLFEGVDGQVYKAVWSVRRAYGKPDGSIQKPERELQDAAGNTIVRSIREVDQRVEELVGMNDTQFQHVVLLAQGKFAEFLKAKSRDKSELLERITNTEVFSRIGMEIHRRYAEVKNRKEELVRQITAIQTCSDEELVALKERSGQAKQRMVEVEATSKKHQEAIADLETLEALATSYGEAQEELKAAKLALDALAPKQLLCRQWVNAQGVRPTVVELQRIQGECGKQERVIRDSQNRLPRLATELKQEQEQAKRLEERSGQLDARRLELEKRRVQIEGLDAQLKTAEGEVQRAREEQEASRREVQRMVELVEPTAKELKQAKDLQAKDEAAYQKLLPMASLWEALDSWVGPIGEYPLLCTSLRAKEQGVKVAKEGITGLEKQVEQGAKALEELESAVSSEVLHLRASLEEGQPCPVCGSTSHPVHAVDEDSVVNMADLEKQRAEVLESLNSLKDRLATERNNLSRQEGELATVAERLEQVVNALDSHFAPFYPTYRTDLQSELSCEQLVRNAKGFDTVKQRCRQHVNTVDSLTKQLAMQSEALEKQRELFEQREKVHKTRTEEHDALATKRSQLLDGQTIEGRELALGREAEQLAKDQKDNAATLAEKQKAITEGEILLRNAQTEAQRLAEEEKESREAVDSWLAVSEYFEDMQALVATLEIERETITDYEEQIAKAQSEMGRATAVCGERQVALDKKKAELSAKGLASLNSEQVQLEACLVDLEKWKTEWVAVEKELGVQENLRKQRTTLANQLDKLRSENKPLAQLDELFGDPQGAKFRKYAQARNMDNLITWANIYLQGIMPRYSLEMTGSENLLSLMVVDGDLADSRRHVSSLSGGETFVISLAFALALSELASSGAQQLEMLFIDEGFGTLDDTTLNLVSEALNRMQQSGRKVGFISHVQQLTERMPVRIEVRPTSAGASRVSISEQ